MYVAELDRSWLQTPFAGHGFLVTQQTQIATLRMYCDYVYIDPARSDPAAMADLSRDMPPAAARPDQLSAARFVLKGITERIDRAVREARRFNAVDLVSLRQCAHDIVETVTRYADPIVWLLMTEQHGGLIHRRAAGTAVLSSLFGRHLGFNPPTLNQLALGGLLLDIGKTGVPMPILVKPASLNHAERLFVTQHVQQSLAILRSDGDISGRVIEMVLGHHERMDGSGYPNAFRRTAIPLFARIAGIVDTFDALTLNRRYATGMSAHNALRFLNSLRGSKFDSALVSEFVHALGIFPTGTCVEMVNGARGLVCRQNPEWPLQPHVVMLRDGRGRAVSAGDAVESGIDAHIARALPSAELRLMPAELADAFARGHAAA